MVARTSCFRPSRAMWATLVPVLLMGCASQRWEPVRFATTRGATESFLDPFQLQGSPLDLFSAAPFREVQRGMGNSIGRPTQFMQLNPEQIHAHLASGRIQFAFVDQGDEQGVCAEGAGQVIARPVFKDQPPTCTALFVVPTDSPIKELSDLKGKVVAFGPPNHPALHWAALDALKEAGVQESELRKQLVPIPGSLQFHINSLEAAKAALLKIEAHAGVVEEAEFMRWPETGGNVLGNVLSLSISRDQLRVIGRTRRVPTFPSGAVIASRRADSELVEKVRAYLTRTVRTQERLTKALGLVRYESAEQLEKETAGAKTTSG